MDRQPIPQPDLLPGTLDLLALILSWKLMACNPSQSVLCDA